MIYSRWTGRLIAGVLMTSVAMLSFAQTATPTLPQKATPAFEVAAIKLHVFTGQGGGRIGVRVGPGSRVNAYSITLQQLMRYAYDVKPYQVTGGPAEDASATYDISAKAEGEETPSEDNVRKMVQALLADRFALKFHRETKDVPLYALVVATNGSKLKESGADAKQSLSFRMGPSMELNAGKTRIATLVLSLARFLDRPVIDKTGLDGFYDVTLMWTPEAGLGRGLAGGTDAPAAPDPAGPSIFTAIQEQLGLKLESQKGPMELLVIDHAEKPSEN